MQEPSFDRTLARVRPKRFQNLRAWDAPYRTPKGRYLPILAKSCENCTLCAAVGRGREGCIRAHVYGMTEAQRFGGKYIYFCPMGLTCFVSPILAEDGAAAKITVGPFIMVEKQDFIDCELEENARLTGDKLQKAAQAVETVPFVPPAKVNHLSTLLFMAVGFMNNVSQENRLLQSRRSDAIQGQDYGRIFSR